MSVGVLGLQPRHVEDVIHEARHSSRLVLDGKREIGTSGDRQLGILLDAGNKYWFYETVVDACVTLLIALLLSVGIPVAVAVLTIKPPA